MSITGDLHSENLLRFLYQTPYGVISTDVDGNIELMNAFATQLLMPLAATADFTQFYSILDLLDVDVSNTVKQYSKDSGTICDSIRLSLKQADERDVYLDITIIKLSENSLMMGLMDSTLLVERENTARIEAEKRAESAARLDMATSVIHDIGNAITAVGISAAKLVAADQWAEIPNIIRIKDLLAQNQQALDTILGDGKGKALVDFIDSIKDALEDRQGEQINTAASIAQNIHHVQDIIRIQKQFARDGEGAPRVPVIFPR